MTLSGFFEQNPSGALAFSGGVDSSLLVWAARTYGRDWRAYYMHTAFQPAFELADARRIAEQCGMPLTVLEGDILSVPEVAANPADRCYHCKRHIFSAIGRQAAADGYRLLIDGTNASDDAGDRPGMRALQGGGPGAVPGGGAVRLEQARLRLSRHPHPQRHRPDGGGPGPGGAGGGPAFLPGVPGLPHPALRRRGGGAASPKPAQRRLGPAGGDPGDPVAGIFPGDPGPGAPGAGQLTEVRDGNEQA